jgi:hypothetical protein
VALILAKTYVIDFTYLYRVWWKLAILYLTKINQLITLPLKAQEDAKRQIMPGGDDWKAG